MVSNMLIGLKLVGKYMFGPRLYGVYGNSQHEGFQYEGNVLERWGDNFIHCVGIMWKFGMYTSPIIGIVLYRKGYFVYDGVLSITKFLAGVGILFVASICFRSIGRATNSTYRKFLADQEAAESRPSHETRRALARYDFDFYAMPVEFRASPGHRTHIPADTSYSLFCDIISYVVAHTIGVSLIYPGSISFLQMAMRPYLVEGRKKLIEENRGERFKILSQDGNYIDTIFVDKRKRNDRGDTLVICCEGNAGFYEIGMMVTPVGAGYSVLGWNHPGFGGSTGAPYPPQEVNAMDAVVQFAIKKLDFQVEKIVLFGWSIGGYPVTWAAMNYPEVQGVILDATFDDILPLAIPRMPMSWGGLVKCVVRKHFNMNNYKQLEKYPGNILLIRRTEDEVITTEPLNITTNRGNFLLMNLLRNRYPKIFDNGTLQVLETDMLHHDNSHRAFKEALWSQYEVNEEHCMSLLSAYIAENSKTYPINIGEGFSNIERIRMALVLADKYLLDFKSNHCNPLPSGKFILPREIPEDPGADFVQHRQLRKRNKL